MPPGDNYRIKAAEMNAGAKHETNSLIRAEMENLALAYLRLADQADRNAGNDVVYETPPDRTRPQVQQQQQSQPKAEPEG